MDYARDRAAGDAVTRRLLRLPKGVAETHERIGGVPVIRYSTTSAETGVVLYLHGGAYVLGTAQQGAAAAYLCTHGGPDVVSVEYRLAPEHPFPAAVDDAIAVYRELVAPVGQEKVVVVGESAGGGLLLLLLQRAWEEGLPMPAAAAPAFPAADLTLTAPSVAKNKGKDMLVVSELRQEARWFAGEIPLDDPSVSPLFGSFGGFPPTYIAVGTRDLLHDDSRQLAKAMRADGVDVILDEWPGTIHGFTAVAIGEGRQHRRRLLTFVRNALHEQTSSR